MSSMEKNKERYNLALKEFKISALAGALFIFISCLVSYIMAYGRDPHTVKLVMGFPDWIFWGVLIPWLGIVIFTVVYGLFFMEGER